MDVEQTMNSVPKWEMELKVGRKAIENGNFPQAERLFTSAFQHVVKHGSDDPRLINIHMCLADMYAKQENYKLAERHFVQATSIMGKKMGYNYHGMIGLLQEYANMLNDCGREDDANVLIKRAEQIERSQIRL